MITFPTLTARGARIAAMSDVPDGDCGWDGGESGTRGTFLRACGTVPGRLVAVRQCHGNEILTVTEQDAGRGAGGREGALGDGDGLMTDCPGVPLGITVADCVPVLIACDVAVAAVHAGREGTFRGIARRAVERLRDVYGVQPAQLSAVIGPSAGPCCYEVSPEMASDWVQNGMVGKGRMLDLWESNQQQLLKAGMHGNCIAVTGHCTICQPGFHSYRGMQTPRRNLAIIQR